MPPSPIHIRVAGYLFVVSCGALAPTLAATLLEGPIHNLLICALVLLGVSAGGMTLGATLSCLFSSQRKAFTDAQHRHKADSEVSARTASRPKN